MARRSELVTAAQPQGGSYGDGLPEYGVLMLCMRGAAKRARGYALLGALAEICV